MLTVTFSPYGDDDDGSDSYREIYEDNANDRISDEQFDLLNGKYGAKKSVLQKNIEVFEADQNGEQNQIGDIGMFIAKVCKVTDFTELTPELVHNPSKRSSFTRRSARTGNVFSRWISTTSAPALSLYPRPKCLKRTFSAWFPRETKQ